MATGKHFDFFVAIFVLSFHVILFPNVFCILILKIKIKIVGIILELPSQNNVLPSPGGILQ